MKLNKDNHFTIEYSPTLTVSLYDVLSSWITDRNKEISAWIGDNIPIKDAIERLHERSAIEIVKDTLSGANVDLDRLHEQSMLPCDYVFYNIIGDGSFDGSTNILTDTVEVTFLKYAPKSDSDRYPDLDTLKNFAFGWLADCISDESVSISTDVDYLDGNFMKVTFVINNTEHLTHC